MSSSPSAHRESDYSSGSTRDQWSLSVRPKWKDRNNCPHAFPRSFRFPRRGCCGKEYAPCRTGSHSGPGCVSPDRRRSRLRCEYFFSLSLPAQRLSRLELRASKLPLSTLRMLYLPNNSTIRLDASPRRLALLVVTIRSMFTASVRLRLSYAHLLQTASWDPVALRRPHL